MIDFDCTFVVLSLDYIIKQIEICSATPKHGGALYTQYTVFNTYQNESNNITHSDYWCCYCVRTFCQQRRSEKKKKKIIVMSVSTFTNGVTVSGKESKARMKERKKMQTQAAMNINSNWISNSNFFHFKQKPQKNRFICFENVLLNGLNYLTILYK